MGWTRCSVYYSDRRAHKAPRSETSRDEREEREKREHKKFYLRLSAFGGLEHSLKNFFYFLGRDLSSSSAEGNLSGRCCHLSQHSKFGHSLVYLSYVAVKMFVIITQREFEPIYTNRWDLCNNL